MKGNDTKMYELKDSSMVSQDELIKLISNEADVRQYVVKKVLRGLAIQIAKQTRANKKVKIIGLGVFSRYDPMPRLVRSIHTHEMEEVYPKSTVKFDVSSTLKGRVND